MIQTLPIYNYFTYLTNNITDNSIIKLQEPLFVYCQLAILNCLLMVSPKLYFDKSMYKQKVEYPLSSSPSSSSLPTSNFSSKLYILEFIEASIWNCIAGILAE